MMSLPSEPCTFDCRDCEKADECLMLAADPDQGVAPVYFDSEGNSAPLDEALSS